MFGSRWETPLLRSQQEADVLAKMRVGNRFPFGPKIVETSVPTHPPTHPPTHWRVFPVAELHETADKKLWSVSGA